MLSYPKEVEIEHARFLLSFLRSINDATALLDIGEIGIDTPSPSRIMTTSLHLRYGGTLRLGFQRWLVRPLRNSLFLSLSLSLSFDSFCWRVTCWLRRRNCGMRSCERFVYLWWVMVIIIIIVRLTLWETNWVMESLKHFEIPFGKLITLVAQEDKVFVNFGYPLLQHPYWIDLPGINRAKWSYATHHRPCVTSHQLISSLFWVKLSSLWPFLRFG